MNALSQTLPQRAGLPGVECFCFVQTDPSPGQRGSATRDFGNLVVKPVFETRSREFYGITVNIGDETAKHIEYPLNLVIAPGKKLHFAVEFLASKSCTFQLKCESKYRIGQAETAKLPIERRLAGRIIAPKKLVTSFVG